MPIDLYPSIAKVKRNGVYQNLPGFVPETGDESAQAMIANAETSTTAQFAHPKDSYFRLNNTLYQADADIAVNDTIAVGTNCHVAVLGNNVTKNQNDIENIEIIVKEHDEILMPSDGINHTWIQGGFHRQTGNNINTNFIIRESGSIYKGQYAKFTCNDGYKMSLWAWNISSGTFIGHVLENGEFGKSSDYTFFTELDIDDYPSEYRYRIALHHNDTTVAITPDEGINMIWHINIGDEINKINITPTLSNNPIFGDTVSTIFANNDQSAISGLDDGLINNVSVVKISDEMYYMYYGAFASGEGGYANESLCFAYSTDGLTFIKDFPVGITPPFESTTRLLAKGTIHGACVVRVPDANYPFRMCGIDGQSSDRVAKLWKSIDGVNWVFVKQLTQGYNDSFPSCVVKGNTLKFYLRSRDSNKNRIIVTLITDLDGNHITVGYWNQAISTHDSSKQLYIAAASRLDECRDLLIPTVYNPTDDSETVCFITVDGGHYDIIEPDVSVIIPSDVKSIYFAPNLVGVSYFTMAYFVTRDTSHNTETTNTVSKIKRVRVYDDTITGKVTP